MGPVAEAAPPNPAAAFAVDHAMEEMRYHNCCFFIMMLYRLLEWHLETRKGVAELCSQPG